MNLLTTKNLKIQYNIIKYSRIIYKPNKTKYLNYTYKTIYKSHIMKNTQIDKIVHIEAIHKPHIKKTQK